MSEAADPDITRYASFNQFFAEGRSEWDPETLHEQPYDVAAALRLAPEIAARMTVTQQCLTDIVAI